MAENWKEVYEWLRIFIADNSGIVVNRSEISIPQNLREEFYLRFDRLRTAVVEAHYDRLPVDLDALSRQYLQIEKEVMALLSLESITMPTDLHSLLHAPREGLTRAIYNRVFDLLQGKTTVSAFENQCAMDLKTSSAELFRLGYEWWAGLTVIKLLEPDQAFGVDLDEEYKPFLTDLKGISFGRQAHHPTIRIPEFVLHSRKLNKFVALKMAIAREVETYGGGLKPPVRPKKRTGDTSFVLDSRVMLLSLMRTPESIPVIADIYERTLTSPDWMVECITGDDLNNPDALEAVRLRTASMSPALGTCLIVMDPSAPTPSEVIAENIHPVSVGFDAFKLQPAIAALA
jgi:hypothetical protein